MPAHAPTDFLDPTFSGNRLDVGFHQPFSANWDLLPFRRVSSYLGQVNINLLAPTILTPATLPVLVSLRRRHSRLDDRSSYFPGSIRSLTNSPVFRRLSRGKLELLQQ
jgi:hypothetical protein